MPPRKPLVFPVTVALVMVAVDEPVWKNRAPPVLALAPVETPFLNVDESLLSEIELLAKSDDPLTARLASKSDEVTAIVAAPPRKIAPPPVVLPTVDVVAVLPVKSQPVMVIDATALV